MNNKVLIGMTRDCEIYNCVNDNFKFMGKEALFLKIPFTREHVNEKGFFFKIKLWLNLYILKKSKYIQIYGEENEENYILNLIRSSKENIKEALFIRPDLYTDKVIDEVTKHIPKTIAYQWDGLDRYPKVLSLISKFSHFYIYDKKDQGRFNNTSLISNFYFDCYLSENKKKPRYDAYYLGSLDDRLIDVVNLCEKLEELGMKLKILIYCSKKELKYLEKYDFIKPIHDPISYKQNLENVFDSEMLLDFGHKELHNGLSLRPFEALGYSKKLITTNPLVKEYDFYDESNILILKNHLKTDDLEDFIRVPYRDLDQEIYKKHSFSSWYKRVMNFKKE